MIDLTVIASLILAVSLLRNRLTPLPVTIPMILIVAGMVLSPDATGILSLDVEDEFVALLAELALALLLFADATRINITSVKQAVNMPARLLLIGMPITIAVGTAMTAMLLTGLNVTEAALIAAILAPTDAALGEAVVSNRAVPRRIRQALNIESGLNDGLVVPVVSVLITVVVGSRLEGTVTLLTDAIREIAVGVGIGIGVAWLLSVVLTYATKQTWTDSEGVRLATLGGAVAAFGGATITHGNGFIAAFIGGLLFHKFMPGSATEAAELAEDAGQLAASVVFVVFGAVMVIPALGSVSLPIIVCAFATLTIGRIIPVAIATLGLKMKWPSVVFLGWFGPRGLASIVFGLLLVGEYGDELENADDLFAVIVLVVLSSALLHGATAAYGATRYSQWFKTHGNPDFAEAVEVPDIPMRGDRTVR